MGKLALKTRIGRRCATRTVLICAALATLCASAIARDGTTAAQMRGEYVRLAPQLYHNSFHRPLYVQSEESGTTLRGDVYAVVEYPFITVREALGDPDKNPDSWCEILILHLNVKYCKASMESNSHRLTVDIGKKTEQSISSAFQLQLEYRTVNATGDHLEIVLGSDNGPMGTTDFRLALEAIPIGSGKTFLHFMYSYGYGLTARAALRLYLSTIGHAKVGFTRIRDPGNGQAEYVGGLRGLIERNAMRYYLAIDAYLGTLSVRPDERLDRRLAWWFDATEQYPRQLHEVDRSAYMKMKRNETLRQQSAR